MTQPPEPGSAQHPQADFDRDQALVDLDESIAARQQAIADHEQARLDREQDSIDQDRPDYMGGAFDAHVDAKHRQSGIDRAQDLRDTRQKQLDEEQAWRDDVQDFLDHQRDDIDTGARPTVIDVKRAAGIRQESALARADAAVSRAETTRRRVDAAPLRAKAPLRRFESHQDTEPGEVWAQTRPQPGNLPSTGLNQRVRPTRLGRYPGLSLPLPKGALGRPPGLALNALKVEMFSPDNMR